jgi:hypothetical protein
MGQGKDRTGQTARHDHGAKMDGSRISLMLLRSSSSLSLFFLSLFFA